MLRNLLILLIFSSLTLQLSSCKKDDDDSDDKNDSNSDLCDDTSEEQYISEEALTWTSYEKNDILEFVQDNDTVLIFQVKNVSIDTLEDSIEDLTQECITTHTIYRNEKMISIQSLDFEWSFDLTQNSNRVIFETSIQGQPAQRFDFSIPPDSSLLQSSFSHNGQSFNDVFIIGSESSGATLGFQKENGLVFFSIGNDSLILYQ